MASILNSAEIQDLDDLYFESHNEAPVSVCTCGRPLSEIGQIGGVPADAWAVREPVSCVIVREVSQKSLATFDEPERLSAIFRARYSQAGMVKAGDLLIEADGSAWLVFQPREIADGRPRVRAGLELVPRTMLPAALRNPLPGLPPATPVAAVATGLTRVIAGQWTDADPTTAAADLADPVPLGAVVAGFSSRGNLNPFRIQLSGDRLRISCAFEDPLDAEIDWITFVF